MEPSKIFDVSRPNLVSPGSTSRPVIVGHRPQMSDPTIRRPADSPAAPAPAAPAVANHSSGVITASAETTAAETAMSHHQAKVIEVSQDIKNEISSTTIPVSSSAAAAEPAPQPDKVAAPADDLAAGISVAETVSESPAAQVAAQAAEPAAPQAEIHHQSLPLAHSPSYVTGRLKHTVLWFFIIFFLMAFVLYLAVDAGFIGNGVNLPFHVFNRQT